MEYSQIKVDTEEARSLAFKYYNFTGEITALPGEVDFNFYLKNETGEYILKICRPGTTFEYLDFQVQLIKYLTAQHFPLSIPEIVPSNEGKDFIQVGPDRYLRMQTWVNGVMLDEIRPRTQALLHSWGRSCGAFSESLQGFDHPGAYREQKWDPSKALRARIYAPYFQSDEEKEIANYFWNLFEESVYPKLAGLRKSVNYNDAHEHNLLVNGDLKNPVISGVIDFGDAIYTETVNELAIACAYAAMEMPDPLQAAADVVHGYQEVHPLTEAELSVLYCLIAARLLLTVSYAAWNKYKEPENEYLLISEKPAWKLLKKWKLISPEFAHFRFREVCGLSACPKNSHFLQWLNRNRDEITPVISLENKKVISLDLSVGSLSLGNNSNFDRIRNFSRKITGILEDEDAEMAIGGYGEVRPLYTTEDYRTEGNNGSRWRTVHLGVDLWSMEGTEVYAPVDGVVYSLQNNVGDRNYGPTIILRHEPQPDLIFYSLYGHLSLESLDLIKVGQRIKKGEKIAAIGAPPINGNWPPHLHFQVMLDLLGYSGDFPGVAYPEEKTTWLSICPDPHLFFGGKPFHSQINVSEDLLQKRREILGKNLSLSYDKPLHIVRGFMQHLYDSQGRRYLDTVNNVAHVGHEHPSVVNVAQRQIGVLNTNTRYLHENILLFAEGLLSTFPPELSVVYFVNSGSEANELALRMVETYTGSKEMIVVESGYHGNTNRCIDISHYKFAGKGGTGAPSYTYTVPIPDNYRGLYSGNDAGIKYAGHIREMIGKMNEEGKVPGGFICESILSCGGQIVLPENYLSEAYAAVRSAGGLCIADEVQVGMGRVGESFWAFQLQNVVPDIVTIGKPVGNGHPLGAVVTTRRVADSFTNGMEYFNTFGGNPVSCAIGREVLNIIKKEGLQKNALATGNFLISGLNLLKERFNLIGDVRGRGLFIGIELINNPDSRYPASAEAQHFINLMRLRGILMSIDGPHNNVIKIKPPLCFTQMDAEYLLANMELILSGTYFTKHFT